jgi:hypothetical protein
MGLGTRCGEQVGQRCDIKLPVIQWKGCNALQSIGSMGENHNRVKVI